jgi:hypothetical protein
MSIKTEELSFRPLKSIVTHFISSSNAWNQMGADIDGEDNFDYSGRSVSLSDNGSIMAIGAMSNDGNGRDSGHVRVFRWDPSTSIWNQMGADIDGEYVKHKSGGAVSLSTDGEIVAIGAV